MDVPRRKRNRLAGYNYNNAGIYFITICVNNRDELLGNICVGDGVLDVPIVTLSKYGMVAEKYIVQMQDFYDNIRVDYYIIMPNHVHLLIRITDNELTVDNACKGDAFPCGACSGKDTIGTSRTPSPTNMLISKFVSSFKWFCNREYGGNIWQRSYHDHIIRTEDDLNTHIGYIIDNPLNWLSDKEYQKHI